MLLNDTTLLSDKITYKPSHLSRASFGPSSGSLYGPYVARLAAKQQTGVVPLGCYITAHGPSRARLLNATQAIFNPPNIFK